MNHDDLGQWSSHLPTTEELAEMANIETSPLQTIIDSTRERANLMMSELSGDIPQNANQRADHLIKHERARQMLEWADYAEKRLADQNRLGL